MISSKQNHLKGSLIIGYTTQQHLLLDLDKTTLNQAIYITKLIQQVYPDVGNALILESSPPPKHTRTLYQHYGSYIKIQYKPNHHVVFDGLIGYDKCCKIIFTLVDLNILPEEYRDIRSWAGNMTLRVSPKPFTDRTVPAPTYAISILAQRAYANHGGIDRYIEVNAAAYLLFNATHSAKQSSRQPEHQQSRSMESQHT